MNRFVRLLFLCLGLTAAIPSVYGQSYTRFASVKGIVVHANSTEMISVEPTSESAFVLTKYDLDGNLISTRTVAISAIPGLSVFERAWASNGWIFMYFRRPDFSAPDGNIALGVWDLQGNLVLMLQVPGPGTDVRADAIADPATASVYLKRSYYGNRFGELIDRIEVSGARISTLREYGNYSLGWALKTDRLVVLRNEFLATRTFAQYLEVLDVHSGQRHYQTLLHPLKNDGDSLALTALLVETARLQPRQVAIALEAPGTREIRVYNVDTGGLESTHAFETPLLSDQGRVYWLSDRAVAVSGALYSGYLSMYDSTGVSYGSALGGRVSMSFDGGVGLYSTASVSRVPGTYLGVSFATERFRIDAVASRFSVDGQFVPLAIGETRRFTYRRGINEGEQLRVQFSSTRPPVTYQYTTSNAVPPTYFGAAIDPVNGVLTITPKATPAPSLSTMLLYPGAVDSTAIPRNFDMELLISKKENPTVDLVEFYHEGLNHFFMTVDVDEIAGILGGAAGPGWRRVGVVARVWKTLTAAPAGAKPVCRFYGNPALNAQGQRIGPNSHFYTIDPGECEFVKKDKGWLFETGAAFYALPSTPVQIFDNLTINGCQTWSNNTSLGSVSLVNRYYNDRASQGDSNHRFVGGQWLENSIRAASEMAGWKSEGTVFCAGIPSRVI